MCIRKAWCIKIRPLWSKRYTRQGAALHGAHQYDVAIKAQQEGLANEDSPTLCKGFQEVRAAQDQRSDDPTGFDKMFTDPSLISKLKTNPKTAKLLNDPAFVAKLQGFSGDNLPDNICARANASPSSPSPEPQSPPSRPAAAELSQEDVEKEEEVKELVKAKMETLEAKAVAVYFEQDDYNKYLETCQKAGDEGREIRADLKLVAKALGRIGSAYHRKRDLANAIEFLKKSRIEHRTPDILNKLCETEKAKADLDWVGPLLLPSVLTQGCTS
ncbi:hypothetical protein EV122DRAFT_282764 [Schizophyllum commune]